MNNNNMKFKIGDNVHSLKRPKGYICTIIAISPEAGREYFALAPMTTRGWPTVNQRKWEYWKIELLEKLTKANKYPHLLTCPKCEVDNKILNAPLRRISAFDDIYQCKRCKENFTLTSP